MTETVQWPDLVPLLLKGTQVTVTVAALSAVVAFFMSFLAGLCLISPWKPVRWMTRAYVEVFRGTSLLVQLFWLYFALPFAGISLPKLLAAVIAIGLNFGAYGAEVVRSAVLAVPRGQWEAARALNMTPGQQLWTVVMPQAFLRMLPPFGNLAIELIKSTSLVYFITLTDLTYQAMILRNHYIHLTPHIFGLVLLMYLAISTVTSLLFRWMERRMTEGRI